MTPLTSADLASIAEELRELLAIIVKESDLYRYLDDPACLGEDDTADRHERRAAPYHGWPL